MRHFRGLLDRAGALARNGVFLATVGSWIASALLVVARFSRAAMLVVACLIVLAGVVQLGRGIYRGRDPRFREDDCLRALLHDDARFSHRWIGAGFALALVALLVGSPLVIAAVGIPTTLAIYVKGIVNGGRAVAAEGKLDLGSAAEECSRLRTWAELAERAPRLPGTAWVVCLLTHKGTVGEISPLRTLTLLLVACACSGYVGLGLAAIVSKVEPHREHQDAGPTPLPDPSGSPAVAANPSLAGRGEDSPSPLPTYEESCPSLPDPLAIDHGLGELFQREGAIEAGCGTRARLAPGTSAVWTSAGVCSGQLRSFAVAAPGHAPVLLYGEPARFAKRVAGEGELLYAEAAEPGNGDVDLVGTRSGSFVFARPSPSVRPGNGSPSRCTEIGGVARPFTRLPPPLAQLWLQLIRQLGWTWPVEDAALDPGGIAFLAYPTGEAMAVGGCNGIASCHVDALGEHWVSEEPALVSLADFAPYMPAHLE